MLDCRLLLVEDNIAVAQATKALLESVGCITSHVKDAHGALNQISAAPNNVDVVLTDIEMPGGMDGIALAKILKERYPNLPIILMSGYANRLDEAVAENFVVMPKPCSLDTLAETIEKALKHRPRSDGQSAAA